MTVHHMISEAHTKDKCPYCGTNHPSQLWSSSFAYNDHYKVLNCSCGRRITIKMPFMGSGHDSWSKGLDKKIAEVDAEFQKK